MRVGLVPDVPHQAVVRRVEDVVQRDRQLDRAEVGRQMPAGAGHRLEQELRAAPSASRGSCLRSSLRRSAGSLMVFKQLVHLDGALHQWLRSTMKSISSRSRAAPRRRTRRAPRSASPRSSLRKRSRTRHAQHADIGRLVLPRILARGLAQRRGIGLGVEHDRPPPGRPGRRLGEVIQPVRALRAEAAAAARTEQHCGADQLAGLVDVHVLQLGQGELPPGAGEVDRLPARHAARAGGGSQQCAPCRAALPASARSAARPAPGTPGSAGRRRPAARWPRRRRHGRSACPRRSTSSSMHGRSSCTSE